MRFARSVASQRSSGSSHTGSSARRPDAGDRGAHVDAPERGARLREERVDLRLVGEVGAERDCAVELRRERLGALAAGVVVHDDARALRRERARAGGADAARRAGDDDALACEPGVHVGA